MDLEIFSEKAIYESLGCGKEHAAFSDCLIQAHVYGEDPLTKCSEVAYPMIDCVGPREDELFRALDVADQVMEKEAEFFVPKFQGHDFISRGIELLKEGPCKESVTKMFDEAHLAEAEDSELVVTQTAAIKCMQDHFEYYIPLNMAAHLVKDKILYYDDKTPFE